MRMLFTIIIIRKTINNRKITIQMNNVFVQVIDVGTVGGGKGTVPQYHSTTDGGIHPKSDCNFLMLLCHMLKSIPFVVSCRFRFSYMPFSYMCFSSNVPPPHSKSPRYGNGSAHVLSYHDPPISS